VPAQWLIRAIFLAPLVTGCAGAQGGSPACTYDEFEGTCRLTNVWMSSPEEGVVTLEAQYETPREPSIVRHEVAEGEAERWRRHLARHARLKCRGRAIETGSCDPGALEVDLPPLGP
jgi:hypothetical protein